MKTLLFYFVMAVSLLGTLPRAGAEATHGSPLSSGTSNAVALNGFHTTLSDEKPATATRPTLKERLTHKMLQIIAKKMAKGKAGRPWHWANIVSLGCLGLGFILGFPFILAIVFGGIGMSHSGPEKEYAGYGAGLAGVITGAVIILLAIIFIALILANMGE